MLLGVLMTLVFSGCVASSPVVPFQQMGKVWPEPPNGARIAYVGEFSDAGDLGIRESIWSRIVSFSAGARKSSLQRPMAVVSSEDGNLLFVADTETRCVHRFDLTRSKYRCMSLNKNRQRVFPIGLAVTSEGGLFVSDSQSAELYVAEPDEESLSLFHVSLPLEQPTGLFWDDELELLFVTDTGDQTIKVFDRLGNFKYAIGGRGNGPGQFNFPTYIWIDDSHELLVTDTLNFRLQRLTPSGEPLQVFGDVGDRPGDFSRPKGVATDSLGHIYVVDALMHAVQVYNREGELLMAFARQGQGQGEFWLPNGIYVSSNDTIYVADSYNKRVQVFRYIGPES
jgi:sugar lactone lactonase YvrE